MSRYTIYEAVVGLDETSEIMEWFDTVEDAEAYVEGLEKEEEDETD